MRHRRGADLALLEALGDDLVAGHQPDRGREVGRAGGELHERGEHVEVEAARVDLPDAGQHPLEAEVGGDPLLEVRQLLGVAVEEVEHVLGGAHRALDAAQRVAGEQVLDALDGDQHLVGGGREPLAQRGRLRGDVVGAAGHHGGLVLGGETAEAGQGGDGAVAQQGEGLLDLQLLDVLGEVAAGHPLVDVLVAGQRAELLDTCLHVVAGDPLARGDRVEVDGLLAAGHHGLVGLDHPVGHLDAEVLLGLQHRDPELALQDDLVLGRPDLGQVGGGVAGGEDVRDGHGGHCRASARAGHIAVRGGGRKVRLTSVRPSRSRSKVRPLHARLD